MENNKKGMFTGFSKVFSFTASQSVKGRGFKTSTIVMSLIIAVLFALINIIMATSQLDDEKAQDDLNQAVTSETQIKLDVYYVNETDINNELIEGMTEAEVFKESKFYEVDESEYNKAVTDVNAFLEDKKNAVVMYLTSEEDDINIEYLLPYETETDEDDVDLLAELFVNYFDYVKVNTYATLDEWQMELYSAGNTYGQAVEAGEEPQDLSITLAKIFVPMLCTLALYLLALMYGQNVTKVVISEKSSRLMETLLTSVKPYALIAGKVLAVSSTAIFQMIIWVIAGVIGYIAGKEIALIINADYTNYVEVMIDIIAGASDAFSMGAVIVAVAVVIVGFLMYSVLAALIAASVDKVEDISSVMSLYQLPISFGYLGAYLIPLMENDLLTDIVRYIPITAAFCVPSDVIMGNTSIVQAVAALAILLLTTFVLVLFTAKIYKGKLFNRH